MILNRTDLLGRKMSKAVVFFFHVRLSFPTRDLQVTAILQVVDKEGSGFLSVSELIAAMKNDRFEHALRTVGIDIRMPEHYFKTLASVTEQDELSIDEFVAHIVQMKGSVSRTDVQTLTLETALLQKLVCT